MSGESGNEDEIINFDRGDILVMIAELTNAVIAHNTAIGALMIGDLAAAHDSNLQAGQRVDAILDLFRRKIGDEVVDDER